MGRNESQKQRDTNANESQTHIKLRHLTGLDGRQFFPAEASQLNDKLSTNARENRSQRLGRGNTIQHTLVQIELWVTDVASSSWSLVPRKWRQDCIPPKRVGCKILQIGYSWIIRPSICRSNGSGQLQTLVAELLTVVVFHPEALLKTHGHDAFQKGFH